VRLWQAAAADGAPAAGFVRLRTGRLRLPVRLRHAHHVLSQRRKRARSTGPTCAAASSTAARRGAPLTATPSCARRRCPPRRPPARRRDPYAGGLAHRAFCLLHLVQKLLQLALLVAAEVPSCASPRLHLPHVVTHSAALRPHLAFVRPTPAPLVVTQQGAGMCLLMVVLTSSNVVHKVSARRATRQPTLISPSLAVCARLPKPIPRVPGVGSRSEASAAAAPPRTSWQGAVRTARALWAAATAWRDCYSTP
jgi:hypothetical protein